MSTATLTQPQSVLLTTAIDNHGWTPEVKQAARRNVALALERRGLLEVEGDGWRVTAAGYAALGLTPPQAPTRDNGGAVLLDEIDGGDPADEEIAASQALDPEVEADTEAEVPTAAKPRRSREDSKQATVIRMLRRPEGATLEQLVAATQWQKHSVRGALSLLGKKQGLTIASEKTEAGRVYRAA